MKDKRIKEHECFYCDKPADYHILYSDNNEDYDSLYICKECDTLRTLIYRDCSGMFENFNEEVFYDVKMLQILLNNLIRWDLLNEEWNAEQIDKDIYIKMTTGIKKVLDSLTKEELDRLANWKDIEENKEK